jgi:hypothetical protein
MGSAKKAHAARRGVTSMPCTVIHNEDTFWIILEQDSALVLPLGSFREVPILLQISSDPVSFDV